MNRTFSFKCATCGELHEGSPSLSFSAPFHWREEMRDDPTGASKLDSDFCMIERRDYFIRCVLEIEIHDADEPFTWGIWMSQSDRNFRDYAETFYASPERQTFGYFSNRLPDYPDTVGLHCQVHWRAGGQRPWVEIRPTDHQLYLDWLDGISWERAAELAAPLIHPPAA